MELWVWELADTFRMACASCAFQIVRDPRQNFGHICLKPLVRTGSCEMKDVHRHSISSKYLNIRMIYDVYICVNIYTPYCLILWHYIILYCMISYHITLYTILYYIILHNHHIIVFHYIWICIYTTYLYVHVSYLLMKSYNVWWHQDMTESDSATSFHNAGSLHQELNQNRTALGCVVTPHLVSPSPPCGALFQGHDPYQI